MKKRILSLVMIAALAIGMMSGCAKPKSADSTPAPGETKQENTEKPIKLTWYYPGPAEAPDQGKVQDALNTYLKDKINVEVEMHCLDWANYQQKVDQMISAGEVFDICWTAGWMGYNNNSVKGAYAVLDDLFEQYAPKTKALFEDKFLDTIRVNGKLYAVPTNTDKAFNYGILYRKDLADKYGIDFSNVKTYEDTLPLMEMIKQKEPDIIPFSTASVKFPNYINTVALDQNSAAGLNGYIRNDVSNDNKVYNLLESEEFMEQCKLMRKINESGYMRKDVLTYQDFDSDDNNGKTFMEFAKLKPGVEDEITSAAVVPGVVWAQHPITEPMFGDGSASMTSISRTSKNPEAAMKFLEILNTDKYVADLVNYGIEDLNYNRVDETYIEPIANSGYSAFLGQQWILCNQYILSLLPNESADKWKKMDDFNARATYSRASGFVFDTSNVKTQIAAVTNINESMLDAIKLGVVDPEVEIPKLHKKLQSAGEDEIIAEMQTQWDAFIASQEK